MRFYSDVAAGDWQQRQHTATHCSRLLNDVKDQIHIITDDCLPQRCHCPDAGEPLNIEYAEPGSGGSECALIRDKVVAGSTDKGVSVAGSTTDAAALLGRGVEVCAETASWTYTAKLGPFSDTDVCGPIEVRHQLTCVYVSLLVGKVSAGCPIIEQMWAVQLYRAGVHRSLMISLGASLVVHNYLNTQNDHATYSRSTNTCVWV